MQFFRVNYRSTASDFQIKGKGAPEYFLKYALCVC